MNHRSVHHRLISTCALDIFPSCQGWTSSLLTALVFPLSSFIHLSSPSSYGRTAILWVVPLFSYCSTSMSFRLVFLIVLAHKLCPCRQLPGTFSAGRWSEHSTILWNVLDQGPQISPCGPYFSGNDHNWPLCFLVSVTSFTVNIWRAFSELLFSVIIPSSLSST